MFTFILEREELGICSVHRVTCLNCPILLMQAVEPIEKHHESVYIGSQRSWVLLSAKNVQNSHGSSAHPQEWEASRTK